MSKRKAQDSTSSIVFNDLSEGVSVFPISYEKLHQAFNLEKFLKEQIEFKESNPPLGFVMGSFGALGHPTSFHHPELRKLRIFLYREMFPIFSQIHPGRKLEMIFDRFSIRRDGTSISSESWHRDVGTEKKANEIIYGGWINLDPEGIHLQSFSCVPGDILDPSISSSDRELKGFARFTSDQAKRLSARKRIISVPPAHLIVFDQTIAHEILAKKMVGNTSYKCYIGWRISDDTLPLYDLLPILSRQSVPPLPSGDYPPMYFNRHWINWRDRLIDFSRYVKDEFIEEKQVKKGNNNTPVRVVQRVMPSLESVGMMWPAYTEEETIVFLPRALPAVPSTGDLEEDQVESGKEKEQENEKGGGGGGGGGETEGECVVSEGRRRRIETHV